jgi:hypothetical protein
LGLAGGHVIRARKKAMTDNKSPDEISSDNLEKEAGDAPDEEKRTFASGNAPWIGTEHQWKREKTTGKIKRPEKLIEESADSVLPDTRSMAKPALAEDQKTVSVRPDSYPPDYNLHAMNRSSLPAIAAQSQANKKLSSETKLGIAATVLATIIVLALLTWYFLDVRSESAQTKEMQTVQQMMIERLEHRIQEMDDKDLSKSERQAIRRKVRALAAQLMAAKNGITEQEITALPSDAETDLPFPTGNAISEASVSSPTNANRSPAASSTEGLEGNGEQAAGQQEAENTDKIPPSPYEMTPVGTQSNPKKEQDKLDSLLGSSKPKSPAVPQNTPVATTVPVPSTTPEVPSRAQVRKAMSAVGPTVKKCGGGIGGKIKMEMAISGETGRVISAQPIGSEHAGTSTGICATRAVSLAKFPKFQKRILVIKYPFEL